MSKQRRELQELMTAVDDGRVVDVYVDGGTSSGKLAAPRRGGRHRRDGRRSAPPVLVVDALPVSPDASFEFSAVVSYSAASPASMVFSDGQLRAHQFPAVRSPAGSRAASPDRPVRSSGKHAAVAGSKKRVRFVNGEGKATAKSGGAQGKKSGGLMGCMGSACGMTRDQVVEPATKNVHHQVAAA
ncbi:hypothetical protein ACP4OV_007566 [Aristida adscensionis]